MKRDVIKRKLRKLRRNPRLFFSDMKSNHNKKSRKGLRIKKNPTLIGCNKYTVVSAVYNVEKYLEAFIKSIVNQDLNFKRNIYLVLVDDGSTDGSSHIISRWKEKYPENITYIRKENGGQASARNLGMDAVKTDWVTFIDPDDFINREYFSSIDVFLDVNKFENIKLVSCKMVVYREDLKEFRDTQPLAYCFERNGEIVNSRELDGKIQLSASAALFKKDLVVSSGLKFNAKIKPGFEDGKFVLDYLLLSEGNVAFLNAPNYYYRVREDDSSTTNGQWERPEKYKDVLEYGYIPLLSSYNNMLGHVPRHIQRTVLFFLSQYFLKFVNNSDDLYFLTDYQKNDCLNLMDECFSYIDSSEILKFNLLGVWFFHKVGMNSVFKRGVGFGFQMIYVRSFDFDKKLLQLNYYSDSPSVESIKLDGDDTLPYEDKTIAHDFLGRDFYERSAWVSFQDYSQELSVGMGGRVELSIFGKGFPNGIKVGDIANVFTDKAPSFHQGVNKYKDAWLFMDSVLRAGDNAEHLYRYIADKHSKINAYFILSNKSKDWKKLKGEGFKLIDANGKEFRKAYASASKLISSHTNSSFITPFGKDSTIKKKFIFLQHGVIANDLSKWLNNTSRIDCLVTSTLPEYNSIVSDNSSYRLGTKETVLTGLPRHDRLRLLKSKKSKMILIMPTWRGSLAGEIRKGRTERDYNHDFDKSEYFDRWQGVLGGKKLEDLSEKFGYEVTFMPHPNLVQYLDQFKISSSIKVINCNEVDMQEYIASCSLLVTDYSSVTFDVAYLGKPSIYYQFDEDEVFNGRHTISRGYFDYRDNGFGEVVSREEDLFVVLNQNLKNECRPSRNVVMRMAEIFPNQDGNNCERVYQAISSLEDEVKQNVPLPKLLEKNAQAAMEFCEFNLAEQRYRKLLEIGSRDQVEKSKVKLIRLLHKQGKVEAATRLFNHCFSSIEESAINREGAFLAMARHDWSQAVVYFKRVVIGSCQEGINFIRCLAEIGSTIEIKNTRSKEWALKLTCIEDQFIESLLAVSKQNWSDASNLLLSLVSKCDGAELKQLKPQILLARCFREQGDLLEANIQLVNYEKHTRNDIACREEIAKLAFARNDWEKVIGQLGRSYPSDIDLPQSLSLIKIDSLKNQIESVVSNQLEGQSKMRAFN